MTDVRQSPLWQSYLEKIGWRGTALGQQRAYIRKIFFGSIIKIPRVNPPILFAEIDHLAKKEKVFFVKLEPNVTGEDKGLIEKLGANGFVEENWSLQSTKTITIDLTSAEEDLLAKMEKDTRYSIRKSEREGVKVEKANDFEAFLKLHQETARRQKFWVSSGDSKALWKALPDENKALLLANKDGKVLAGAFLIFFEEVAYYYEAGSSSYRRDLLAPYLVVWEAMKVAKKKGCKKFDFEGIEDSRIPATKDWGGFTHFKKGFGGKEVTYLGSFIKIYNPVVKLIFLLNNFF